MKNKLKVLVIRFSSIGDIVLTSPVVRALKNAEGRQVEVHYATKKKFAAFLENNPHIDLVHVLEDSLGDLIGRLKREEFDYIVDLHNNLRSALIKISLRKPSRSFNKLNYQKWLITTWKINRLPDVHIVDRYLQAAAPLGVKADNQGLDYYLPGNASQYPDHIPSFVKEGFAAFVIGGMHATKRLPNEKIAAICRRLDKPVVLLGGPDDVENARQIVRQSSPKVFNACGMLDLDQSAFMVKQARVVITHDTGLMHIAAAFNKPVVSVWGNTIPGFGMYPYMPQNPGLSHIVEVEGLSCRPCSKIGYPECPLKHFKCMNMISENRVAEIAGKYF